MKQKLYSIVVLLSVSATLYSQTSSERLLEMKNSLNLGLQEKGLTIAAELMSRDEYKDVREETVFFVAEYHFMNSFVPTDSEDKSANANRAYTYYLVYKNDYPGSKYASLVEKRLTTLSSTFSQLAILKNLFDYYYTEASIVLSSIDFTKNLYTINTPNPYYFFFEGKNEPNALQILERYYDDIIINHPEFEIYGYYWKIISNLSVIKDVDYFSDGIMKFDIKKISNKGSDGYYGKDNWLKDFDLHQTKVTGWLNFLNVKYPHNPITLDLNLVFAKIFMKKDGATIDLETKSRLEFVVQNELDKTNPRYMLAKEFLLNNKFGEVD
jgi:hypothetical protein